MKIKEIVFNGSLIFKDHTVVFGAQNIPMISFLVGNNGSGKTRILDTIFQFMGNSDQIYGAHNRFTGSIIFNIELNAEESLKLGNGLSNVLFEVKKIHSDLTRKYTDVISGNIIDINPNEFIKIVYSTVEVNFNDHNISSVTSKDIDSLKNPRERSNNLSSEIPQLLIDIKSLDDSDVANWVSQNNNENGMPAMPLNIGNRLNRFKDAFHKIYDGEKTFHTITNKEGSKKIIFKDKNEIELDLSDLSTGEKQIIYRVGYILKELGNLHGGIILIDEPEISLHPKWQIKLKDLLFEIFKDYDVQIIIATHSPYIFSNLNQKLESCIKIDKNLSESRAISMIFPKVPYNPSVNLINYLAYGIVSALLHIELFTLLQIRENITRISQIDKWFQSPVGGNLPLVHTITVTLDGKLKTIDETLPTWIRNKIHHKDETGRPDFTDFHLKASIDLMIKLLLN
jgi:predicted ATPase